jgi:type II secretory pathway pseudopilin PulG
MFMKMKLSRFKTVARPGRAAGFALIEVLLATVMLAVGGLIVFPTMISYTSLSNAANEESLATFDMQAALEDLRAGLRTVPAREPWRNEVTVDPATWVEGDPPLDFDDLFPPFHRNLPPGMTRDIPKYRPIDEGGAGHLSGERMFAEYPERSASEIVNNSNLPFTVTVSVTWRDSLGRQQRRVLASVING